MNNNITTLPTYPIVGFGIVGKSNKPLFIHSFEDDKDSDLEVNLTIHSCLDVLDERAEANTTAWYLGFLALMGRHSTFAMIGPTRIKVFCVLDADHEPTPKEEDMKKVLNAIHQAYVDWLCNPFVDITLGEGDPIPPENSKYFLSRIKQACETHSFLPK
jgi:hypothetical protein